MTESFKMSRAAFVRPPLIFSLLAALVGGAITAGAQGGLFESRKANTGDALPFRGIEGPAVDADGTLYFVHFKKNGQKIGKISRLKAGAKKSEPLPDLTGGSIGNGIRFDKQGRMYVADYPNHNVLKFEKGQTKATVFFTTRERPNGAPKFNQPNDLAIAADGTLYASDPDFNANTGRIWRIVRDAQGEAVGEIMAAQGLITPSMGTTNGLDLSPDDKTLYVAESNTKKIQAYRIDGTTLVFERTVIPLPGSDPDGLRTDAQGRIYVARNGGKEVIRFKPDGSEPLSIKTSGTRPSNLTFGGPDGKTVFVTQVDGGLIESFRVDVPGREFCKPYNEAAC
jgi:sugar lactone lactonase YvrE